ncbi:hypothetical protein BC829DRAFT_447153 [Chytridium lagenaria]|nr:hypothetical protein BC829DRAFT_447153 [Chytridium lagenaria]
MFYHHPIYEIERGPAASEGIDEPAIVERWISIYLRPCRSPDRPSAVAAVTAATVTSADAVERRRITRAVTSATCEGRIVTDVKRQNNPVPARIELALPESESEVLPLHHGTKILRRPGIEPGTSAWKALIIPLNYRRVNGGTGDRTQGLSHAKRTRYHYAIPPYRVCSMEKLSDTNGRRLSATSAGAKTPEDKNRQPKRPLSEERNEPVKLLKTAGQTPGNQTYADAAAYVDEEPDPDGTEDKDMESSDDADLSSQEYNPTTWASIIKAAASNAEEMKVIANGLPVAHVTPKIINEFLSQFGGMIACPHCTGRSQSLWEAIEFYQTEEELVPRKLVKAILEKHIIFTKGQKEYIQILKRSYQPHSPRLDKPVGTGNAMRAPPLGINRQPATKSTPAAKALEAIGKLAEADRPEAYHKMLTTGRNPINNTYLGRKVAAARRAPIAIETIEDIQNDYLRTRVEALTEIRVENLKPSTLTELKNTLAGAAEIPRSAFGSIIRHGKETQFFIRKHGDTWEKLNTYLSNTAKTSPIRVITTNQFAKEAAQSPDMATTIKLLTILPTSEARQEFRDTLNTLLTPTPLPA